MNRETEIRNMNPGSMYRLIEILEISDSWKKLMEIVPKDLENDQSPLRYNSEHVRLVERHSKKQSNDASAIFLGEWGISGRNRPKIKHLLNLLVKAHLFRAADFVAEQILGEPLPERPPVGPAAKVVFQDRLTESEYRLIEDHLDNASYNTSLLQGNLSSDNINRNVVNRYTTSIPKIIVNSVSDDELSNSNNPSPGDLSFRSAFSDPYTSPVPVQCPSNLIEFSKTIDNSALLPDFNQLNVEDDDVEPMLPQISELMNANTESFQGSQYSPQFSDLLQQDSEEISKEVQDLNVPNMTALLNAESSESNIQQYSFDPVNYSGPQISELLGPASETYSTVESNNLTESSINSTQNDLNSETSIPQISKLLNSVPNITTESPPLNTSSSSDNNETDTPNLPISSLLNANTPVSPLPTLDLNTELPHFNYRDLERCTRNFNESLHVSGSFDYDSRKLGSGAFGSVFLGIGLFNVHVAVKKLHLNGLEAVSESDAITLQFRNEVEVLHRYRHDNLLSLLGYSCDGPTYCLIYEYIAGGVLGDRILKSTPALPWISRLNIAHDVAKAISYLHSAYQTPLIHRDIKSANILLQDNGLQIIPKLSDFGLIKLTPNINTNAATTIFGTSAYMAPEAFRGDVSIKIDTFSFGVVLLELLTGLPPLDENREGNDLVTHVEDVIGENGIQTLLDYRAGVWIQYDINFSEKLYSIANLCLEEKKRRPTMVDVCQQIGELLGNLKEEDD